ncbi:MAG: 30S ribosomal protein S20 [bacterium]|nr:30S ribosomal protein S20 [bacterium]
MPVIKSAKKKLRQDKKRQKRNALVKNALKDLIKKARKKPSLELVKQAVSVTDKAAKHNIIHKNKAARIKSSLSKLVKGKVATKAIKAKTKIKTRPL